MGADRLVHPDLAEPGSGLPLGRAFRRGWPLVLLAAVVALVAGAVVASRQTPEYSDTSRLLVNPLSQSTGQLLGLDLLRSAGDSNQTVQTAAVLIESNEVAQATAQRLRGAWTRQSVLDAVEVSAENESNILSVVATTDDPRTAAEVANAFAQSAVRLRESVLRRQIDARLERLRANYRRAAVDDYNQRDRLNAEIFDLEAARETGDPSLRLAQLAVPPGEERRASRIGIIGISLLGGLLLGILAALALDWLRRSVTTERDALAAYPLPVIGRVPRGGRRGTATTGQDAAAYRRLAHELERLGSDTRVVTLVAPRGGQASKAAAVGLAVALAEEGHSTVLVELDDRQDIGTVLGSAGLPQSLSVLPPSGPGPRSLPERLDRARSMADWVVVDAPPIGDGALAVRAAAASDDVLVVVELRRATRDDLRAARSALDNAGVHPTGALVVGGRGRRAQASGGHFEAGAVASERPAAHTVR